MAREHEKMTETNDTEIQKTSKTESESSRATFPTSTLKDWRGSKPSLRTEQLSGPRSTESVRHSGGSFMKTLRWLSAFEPSFVSKELLSHRFSQRSAWQSRHLCLRSPVVPAPKPSDKAACKSGSRKTYRSLGVP